MVNIFALTAGIMAKHGSQADRKRSVSIKSDDGSKVTVSLLNPPAGFADEDFVVAAEHGVECKSSAPFGNGIAKKSGSDTVGGAVAVSLISALSMNESELETLAKTDATIQEAMAVA